MQLGQMLWYTVNEKEKSGYGKSLDICKQQPVILDIIHETDIDDILNGVNKLSLPAKIKPFYLPSEKVGAETFFIFPPSFLPPRNRS